MHCITKNSWLNMHSILQMHSRSDLVGLVAYSDLFFLLFNLLSLSFLVAAISNWPTDWCCFFLCFLFFYSIRIVANHSSWMYFRSDPLVHIKPNAEMNGRRFSLSVERSWSEWICIVAIFMTNSLLLSHYYSHCLGYFIRKRINNTKSNWTLNIYLVGGNL